VTAIRVGVVCDLHEEGWLSMDLIADMLMDALPVVTAGAVAPTRLCPLMARRWTRLPLVGGTSRAKLADRLTARLWDYPRWLRPRAGDFDLVHIVDHSYAHLVRVLPPGRTVVTCNDMDAIEASPSRLLAAGVLDGLARAARVACISRATRAQLMATGRVNPDRVSVVYLGVHPSCSPEADPERDREIAAQLGPRRVDLLHVGSTIPRKRIDVLLEILRGVGDAIGQVRLLRVGGRLTRSQRALAEKLGVADAIVELPFVERPALAALYRRASLVLLPSDREGFGLPLVEAMACGTPAIASAIPALMEVGGRGATYCPPGDVPAWIESVTALLRQKEIDPCGWQARKQGCIDAASHFDWRLYAREMTKLYSAASEAA
jgi:glycosyltransferase involved in cell wall biosynthesis